MVLRPRIAARNRWSLICLVVGVLASPACSAAPLPGVDRGDPVPLDADAKVEPVTTVAQAGRPVWLAMGTCSLPGMAIWLAPAPQPAAAANPAPARRISFGLMSTSMPLGVQRSAEMALPGAGAAPSPGSRLTLGFPSMCASTLPGQSAWARPLPILAPAGAVDTAVANVPTPP